MTSSIVTSSMKDIEEFLKLHKQIVLKPLNRCFGSGVMYLYDGDPNTHTIINTVTENETTLAMVQEYIPGVKNGDIRVLTLGDKIFPYSIKKLPGGDDFKFNNHSDNFVVKSELTKHDLEYFTPVAQKLCSMGIEMAGLDVIDNKIIEVNVTSPCYFIKEMNNCYGISVEKMLADYLLTPALLSL
jgi:glutathione synthase